MVSNSNKNYHSLLNEGIRAVRDGNKNLAWSLLSQAAKMNPMDATPWLWLTETTEEVSEKIEYLESALAIDPQDFSARRSLAELKGKVVKVEEFSPDTIPHEDRGDEPAGAFPIETYLCPKCGAHMQFDLHADAMMCHSCGYIHKPDDVSAADKEQYLDAVLRTRSGHRWAVTQQQMACGQCGAHSLWPPGQVEAECPYCGSNHLIESVDTEGLVDPQGIAVMQIDETTVLNNIKEWLGKGLTIPDDLIESVQRILLRPAYYPFWTFDGTLELNWSCEVNVGTANNPRWENRTGNQFEMFDDVLIPGLKSLSQKDLSKLGSFNLKDVIEFQSDFLAGWPTLTYNRSLAKASLLAREIVVRKIRPLLTQKVFPGQQKRDLRTGNINWSDMTFKHILLPVWIGNYTYNGIEHSVMVNGQTGVVAGDKPRDKVKTIGIIVSVIATIILLGMIAFLVVTSLM